MTIGPVVLLGLLSIFFMLTTVHSSMMEEIEEGLKGTAAATLAAYDQNTGDYMESSNGDIWKGSYNISKSESLVDRIKGKYNSKLFIGIIPQRGLLYDLCRKLVMRESVS